MIRRRLIAGLSLSLILSGAALHANESWWGATAQDIDSQETHDWSVGLPEWLLGNSFSVRQRIEYQFDGSESAQSWLHRSETREFLVFQDPKHWRVRRMIPFRGSSREILRRPEGYYTVTLSNRKVPSHHNYSPQLWRALVEFPFDLSRRWGFLTEATDWSRWFEEISQHTEALENAEGDRIRVTYGEEDGVRQLRLNFEGSMLYQGELELKVRGEWQIEVGQEISEKMLQTALSGEPDE